MSFEFFIDGRKVSADEGQTILDVARANGIDIPALCSEKRISKTTSCFVCVVKDVKSGKFIPSCASFPAPGQEIESASPEVAEMRRTALNLLLSEHSGDCEAPCTLACPAHAGVEEYVRAGRKGDFLESLKIIKERIPLPMSVGRVCPRFCEKDCRRNIYGKPVAINDFKRLAADLYYDSYMEECAPERALSVAIVGGGPAGLSAAYFLRLEGFAVTVFEAMPAAGGMLRYGIPEYRLPKAILDREIDHFTKLGVKWEFNRKLGEDLRLEELKAKFDAVIVGCGCWQSSGLRCEGEELAVPGIGFLREVAEKKQCCANPGRTIVVGGGNTAMDCLRTAIRLGGTAQCFYRRTESEMPAEKIEIAEAREEGVEFCFLVAPVKLERRNGELVLTCCRMQLGEPDASGRRKPVMIPGSEFESTADTVIAAIGQRSALPAEVPADRFGTVAVQSESDPRFADRCYAAGDCVSGAATVVEAIASGRRAALAVMRELAGIVYPDEPPVNVSRGKWYSLRREDLVFLRAGVADSERAEQPLIPLEERKTTFNEVAHTMSPETVMAEGNRCIECSCSDKAKCKLREFSCDYHASPDAIPGSRLPQNIDDRHPAIFQDRGKCIKCGICVKICKEVVGKSLLSPQKRGFNTMVATAFNAGFPADCSDCGECVNGCPTGALSWRNKR